MWKYDMTDNSIVKNSSQALMFEILGEPASKSNSRRMIKIGGMPRLIKSVKALSYSELFKHQMKDLGLTKKNMIQGDVVVHIMIWYASRRPDLDESLILDLLQGFAYENDRQVKEKHIYWGLDRENPRCAIRIEPKK